LKRLLPVLALVACRPDFGERESLLARTQILAVRGDPPEAKPGDPVRYSLLVAGPDGPVTTPSASWAFCATPKLLTENGAASGACLHEGVVPIADNAPAVDATMPENACALFGPDIASADLRPRDPDVTGGFYQPVRVDVAGTVAFGLERIGCKLGAASTDIALDYGNRYVPNRNPELLPLEVPPDVASGTTITLRARWPETERYVVYDLATRTLVDRRETMRVSWYATAGSFENDRTGRTEDELETFTENTWTAPADAREVHLFAVLRDARGGVAFQSAVVRTIR
jgi:hypothetical protein